MNPLPRTPHLLALILISLAVTLAGCQSQPVRPGETDARTSRISGEAAYKGTRPKIIRPTAPELSRFSRGRKYAIVAAVGRYADQGLQPLDYVVNDIRSLEQILQQQGYTVWSITDDLATQGNIRQKFALLRDQEPETLLFAFSGHGFQSGGDNYLATYETAAANIATTGLSVDDLEDLFEATGAERGVMFIDACRNTPGGKLAGRTFQDEAARGLHILYSTAPGEVSWEDPNLNHSVFSYYLLKGLRGEPGVGGSAVLADGAITVHSLTRYITDQMLAYSTQSGRPQLPYYTAKEALGVPLIARVNAPVPTTPAVVTSSALTSTTLPSIEPNSEAQRLAEERRRLAAEREALAQARQEMETAQREREQAEAAHQEAERIAEEAARLAEERRQIEAQRIALEAQREQERQEAERIRAAQRAKERERQQREGFVRIPAGCFQMGSPASEAGRASDERQHRVCVEPFKLAKHEVTNAQYRRFKPNHDSGEFRGHSLNGDNQPVVEVSWNDAVAYAEWLSRESGQRYRLPTEAEWEYAARAGTTTARYWGDDPDQACRYANVHDQTSKRENGFSWTHHNHNCDDGHAVTAPVGRFQANAYGLHDMLGNVWEWTCSTYESAYGGSEKRCESNNHARGPLAMRGGSLVEIPHWVRSAPRFFGDADDRNNFIGFRLAQD